MGLSKLLETEQYIGEMPILVAFRNPFIWLLLCKGFQHLFRNGAGGFQNN
jgi:hypothetical protein